MHTVLAFVSLLVFFSPVHAQVCPGSDEVEALIAHDYPSAKVFVCGFAEIGNAAPKGKVQANEFTVYVKLPESKPEKIFSVGAMENYWLSKDPKQGLILEELMWVEGKLQPLAKSNINCTETGCARSENVCILRRPKSKIPDIARQIDKKIRGKFTRVNMPLDGMVEVAFSEALAGNQSALTFFKQDWTTKLDPKAVDAFNTSKKSMERVNELKCSKTMAAAFAPAVKAKGRAGKKR